MSDAERRLLQDLHLDHLRVEIDAISADWTVELRQGDAHAAILGAALELGVTVDDGADAQLGALAAEVPALKAPLSRVFVFHRPEKSTPGGVVQMARSVLGGVFPGPVAGGTNAYFAEINWTARMSPRWTASCSPSIRRCTPSTTPRWSRPCRTQADTVISARAFAGNLPLFVGTVTLRPRFNPNATASEAEVGVDELPFQVDPRQRTLFAAVWTLGSLKHLASAGAAAVTYFETTGWRGVVETAAGSPLPENFPSSPVDAFPVYHLLADVREGSPSALRLCESEDPLSVDALVLDTADGLRLLVGNMSPTYQDVVLRGLPRGDATIRRLNGTNTDFAAQAAQRYRSSAAPMGCWTRRTTYDWRRMSSSGSMWPSSSRPCPATRESGHDHDDT